MKVWVFSRLPRGLQSAQTKGDHGPQTILIEPVVKTNGFVHHAVSHATKSNQVNGNRTLGSVLASIATESTNDRTVHSSKSVNSAVADGSHRKLSSPRASHQKR